jgi:putative ABC transport system ATP-binding protein
MELLQALNRNSGITVLMVTHEPDMAAYASRAIHFRDGLVEHDVRSEGVH